MIGQPIGTRSRTRSTMWFRLTRCAEGLSAAGGGIPAGESGPPVNVFGGPKPRKATLRLGFQPAGGT